MCVLIGSVEQLNRSDLCVCVCVRIPAFVCVRARICVRVEVWVIVPPLPGQIAKPVSPSACLGSADSGISLGPVPPPRERQLGLQHIHIMHDWAGEKMKGRRGDRKEGIIEKREGGRRV